MSLSKSSLLLPGLARRRLETITRAKILEGKASNSLLAFVPRISPSYSPPHHLGPYVKAIESALREPKNLVITTPPQHGKTETTLHALVWCMLGFPDRRHAYVTYAADKAHAESRRAQMLANNAGMPWTGSVRRWYTKRNGGLLATGVGGPLTGYGVDGLMIIDDPYKNRAEAESALYRGKVDSWFRSVAATRVHPQGSVIVIQTRWHPNDLAGTLIEEGWETVHLKAIDDDGQALWPEKWPVEALEAKRTMVGEYDWASLYQGEPRPRGGKLFNECKTFDEIPPGIKFVTIGADFAYSQRTHSDYSAAVAMGKFRDNYYIMDVMCEQVDASTFAERLRHFAAKWAAPVSAYVAGPEHGILNLFRTMGVHVNAMHAYADKFVRAQKFAAAWKSGRVFVARNGAWVNDYLSEIFSFTGINDDHDDQVDATVSAFDILANADTSDDVDPKVKEVKGRWEQGRKSYARGKGWDDWSDDE